VFRYNRKPKSNKIVGAERRLKKERTFLNSLTVQADDPDSVLDDDGNVLPVKVIVEQHGENWAESGVKLLNGKQEVFPFDVVESLRVIGECLATVKRLSKG
jgi:hypothetical protein